MKVIACWSGGKDSAMALHAVLQRDDLEVVGLLTTMSAEYERISMHGVRRAMLEAQTAALGLPVEQVYVGTAPKDEPHPYPAQDDPDGRTTFPSNSEYEQKMRASMEAARERGVEGLVFGDIFLEDLRAYRDNNLAQVGLQGIYPLWKRDTRELMAEFTALGFRAVAVCIDEKKLDETFAGRELGPEFVRDLPPTVDPCGENGEFHSFVYAGPIFPAPVPFTKGETVHREGFWFTDLLPPD